MFGPLIQVLLCVSYWSSYFPEPSNYQHSNKNLLELVHYCRLVFKFAFLLKTILWGSLQMPWSERNNLCEARRKSSSTQLSSRCQFKLLEANREQFVLSILKFITIWKKTFPVKNYLYPKCTLKLKVYLHLKPFAKYM